MILPRSFFVGSTEAIAKKLLGCVLVHETSKGRLAGKIVETEAYLDKNDPACHAFNGLTKRNQAMFGPPGFSYVYYIYGMYHCFNVVTGPKGSGSAVLIRALEPLEGIELMQKNRKTKVIKNLCSGPGKLCIAMGINRKHNNLNLRGNPLYLLSPDCENVQEKIRNKIKIIQSKRVGISKGEDLLLRFYIDQNPFISKK